MPMASIKIGFGTFVTNIWIISLWVLIVVDIITKYTHVYGGDLIRISLLVRGIFEMFLIFQLIIFRKLIVNKTFIYISLLLVLFLISRMCYIINNNDYEIKENLIQLNKYIFLFLCFLSLKLIENINISRLFKTVGIIYIVNSIFILLGVIFEIRLFESYYDKPYRFGYSGGILETNAATFVIILSIGTFYYYWAHKAKYKYVFFLILISSLLTGIKGVYGFVLLLAFYHLYKSNLKFKIKFAGLLFISLIILSPVIIEYFQNNIYLFDFFIKTSTQNGFLYMLLSGRHTYIESRGLELLNNWKSLNFLGGYQDVNYLIEMELFDLFLYFGALGSIIYLFVFFKNFIIKGGSFWNFILISIIAVAFLGGHFLTSSVSHMYFTITYFYFYFEKAISNEKNIINK